jgi:hypothetical protein
MLTKVDPIYDGTFQAFMVVPRDRRIPVELDDRRLTGLINGGL